MTFPPPTAGFIHFLPGLPSRNKKILKKLYVSEKNAIEKYRGGGKIFHRNQDIPQLYYKLRYISAVK